LTAVREPVEHAWIPSTPVESAVTHPEVEFARVENEALPTTWKMALVEVVADPTMTFVEEEKVRVNTAPGPYVHGERMGAVCADNIIGTRRAVMAMERHILRIDL
jgi:hypothetical protein